MESLSFDPLFALYDETRTVNIPLLREALEFLTAEFPPGEYAKCLEPGVGNGRVARHLDAVGYGVVGIDISEKMVAGLCKGNERAGFTGNIGAGLADATSIPFKDGAFDIAIAVHLFYFIKDWRKAADEIFRVVRNGGALVLMHTGTGQEIPELNDRYSEICHKFGFGTSGPGVKSTTEVLDYLGFKGFRTERIDNRWKWAEPVHVGRALEYIRRRAYSFTVNTPEDIHMESVQMIEREMQSRFGSLEAVIKVQNQIRIAIIRKELG